MTSTFCFYIYLPKSLMSICYAYYYNIIPVYRHTSAYERLRSPALAQSWTAAYDEKIKTRVGRKSEVHRCSKLSSMLYNQCAIYFKYRGGEGYYGDRKYMTCYIIAHRFTRLPSTRVRRSLSHYRCRLII